MANKYRFRLGRKVNTSVNLVTNGTFTGSLASWTAGSFWSYDTGTALCQNVAGVNPSLDYADGKLTQASIVKPGQYYWLQFYLGPPTIVDPTAQNPARVSYSVGGQYYTAYEEYSDGGAGTTITHENILCHHGNDLQFFCSAVQGVESAVLDNVVLYPYEWNDPLTNDPVNWKDAKITKKRDRVLNGLIVEYIADLTFIGDGYDYLYSQFQTNGFCAKVPIRIEELNSQTGIYEEFFEGIIFINECKFNVSTKQVSVDIQDGNASKIFTANKDVKVSILSDDITNVGRTNYPQSSPDPLTLITFNDDAGAPTYANQTCYLIYNCLRRIIMRSTNYLLDFDSSFFSSGTYQYFCLTNGGLIGPTDKTTEDTFKLSVTELFNELNKLFNLSYSIDNSGSIPKVKIEPKISYYNSTPALTLNLINDLEFEFDTNNIFRSINIGYENVDDAATGIFGNTPEGVQYISTSPCSDKVLNLVSKYIQKSTILKKLLAGTITDGKYGQTWCWIETDGTQTTNSGSGSYDFNINIDTEDNILRHIETLNSSALKTGNEIGNTVPASKTNRALPIIYSFKYPLKKSEFDLITKAYDTVKFNTDGNGATTREGFVLDATFEISTGITEFKLLST